jgi:hypothetical protein
VPRSHSLPAIPELPSVWLKVGSKYSGMQNSMALTVGSKYSGAATAWLV